MDYYYDLWCFFCAILELNSLSSHSISVGEKEQCEQLKKKENGSLHYFWVTYTIKMQKKENTHFS